MRNFINSSSYINPVQSKDDTTKNNNHEIEYKNMI